MKLVASRPHLPHGWGFPCGLEIVLPSLLSTSAAITLTPITGQPCGAKRHFTVSSCQAQSETSLSVAHKTHTTAYSLKFSALERYLYRSADRQG